MTEKDKQNPRPVRVGYLTYWRLVHRMKHNPIYKDVKLTISRQEMIEFVLKNWKHYLSIHTYWVQNGCTWHLTPSIDRIDTYGHYSLDNIQFIPLGENSKKRKTNILYKGETATEASHRLGGSRHLVKTRIRQGWTKKRSFTQPLINQ